ncbi:MAG: Ig-like domain-containing protein [Bacteroidetes bacterium]|nr:Ig-like domain-containing protein [Bacteroidota bacterium]
MKTKKLLTAIAIVSVGLIAGCQKDNFQETIGVCPIVVSTNPINGAAGVRLDKIVTVTFNEKMDPTTINSSSIIIQETTPKAGVMGTDKATSTSSIDKAATISINDKAAIQAAASIAGTITYSDLTATFTPTTALTPNTSYTGRVKTTVKDLMGNALQVEYIWTFTTSATPAVTITDPANNATSVPLNKVVSATFSMPMDSLTITATTFTVKQGTTTIEGIVSYSGSIAIFTPTFAFTPNTIYTGTITTGAKNKAGVSLSSDYIWTFSAGNSPTVISTNPANNATGVVLNQVDATFSVAMDPTTITNESFTLKQGTTTVEGTITYIGSIATFIPKVAFTPNTVYTGTITTQAKNTLGIPLAKDYVWIFTTPFLTPTVNSTDPVNNASDVVLNKVIFATFSVPMDPSTISASTFTLKQGTTLIAGTVSYNGLTASFTPSTALIPNTVYTGTITTGAKNMPGTALATDYIWSFTTGTFAAPTVISTDPTNNTTGVGLNKVVAATFSVPMDASTLTTATFTIKNGTAFVMGSVTYSGSTASFTPDVALTANTVYTCTITTGAKNVLGTSLANDYVWTFTTLFTAPTVTSTDPVNNATGVVLNKLVGATFSVPMNSSTLNATTFTLKQGTTPVAGVVTYSGSTAFFTPSIALTPNTVYTGTITAGAKNMSGTALANDYVWSFTTGTFAAPTVISTDPTNNATGVGFNKVVAATFSVPMDPASITTASFTMKNGTTSVIGTVTYSGSTASFTPNIALTANTIYTCTITTGAKNVLGTSITNDYVWTFTTLFTAPTVISTDPENNATGIVLNKVVAATFSVPMNSSTLTSSTFTLKQGTTAVAGSVSYSGSTAFFTPSVALIPNTVYTGTITTGAKNMPGTSLANDYVWSFTTGTFAAPTVISTDPTNNATGVGLNKVVAATFSVPMDPTSLTTASFTIKQGTTSVIGIISYSGSTASFTPNIALTPNTTYTATITTGAKNVLGTTLANDYVWIFTTLALTAPTITSTDPANNATGVALNKVVAATFSVPMNSSTITSSTFTLKQGTTAVAGTISYSGSTASFTPTSNLLPGTIYTATITTGAKNVAGTPLVNNYVWSFSTIAASGPIAPDLKTAGRFGILSGVGVSNNAGFSVINDLDVGISPGVRSSVTGFPPAIVVNGAIFASDDSGAVAAMLIQAKQDLTDAYLFAAGAVSPAPATVAGDQGGKTLAPGIYKSTSTLLIQSGDLTLDAQGNANAVWIFQVAAGFTTVGGAGGNVILTGGAQAKNVYWQVGSSATIGDFTSFKGNILALTSITMNSGATAVGRMLARNGSVVMTSTNIINKP